MILGKVPKRISSASDNHVRLGGQKLETRAHPIKFPTSYLGWNQKGLNLKSESDQKQYNCSPVLSQLGGPKKSQSLTFIQIILFC